MSSFQLFSARKLDTQAKRAAYVSGGTVEIAEREKDPIGLLRAFGS